MDDGYTIIQKLKAEYGEVVEHNLKRVNDMNRLAQALHKESDAIDLTVPGFNYLGPGTKTAANILANLKPTNRLDEIALHHDLAYLTAVTPQDVENADTRAAKNFAKYSDDSSLTSIFISALNNKSRDPSGDLKFSKIKYDLEQIHSDLLWQTKDGFLLKPHSLYEPDFDYVSKQISQAEYLDDGDL